MGPEHDCLQKRDAINLRTLKGHKKYDALDVPGKPLVFIKELNFTP